MYVDRCIKSFNLVYDVKQDYFKTIITLSEISHNIGWPIKMAISIALSRNCIHFRVRYTSIYKFDLIKKLETKLIIDKYQLLHIWTRKMTVSCKMISPALNLVSYSTLGILIRIQFGYKLNYIILWCSNKLNCTLPLHDNKQKIISSVDDC